MASDDDRRLTDLPGLVARILDPGSSLDLYYRVQERSRRSWRIDRDLRQPWHLLYVPESHAIRGQVEGADVTVEPGQILWIQPFTRIHLSVEGASRGINLGVCRFDLDRSRPPRLVADAVLGRRAEGEAVLDELQAGSTRDGSMSGLLQRAVLARLLCRAFAGNENADEAKGGRGLSPGIRRRLEQFMARNVRQRLTIRDLAVQVGLNPDYLSRRFGLAFGQAPKTHLMFLRIRHASSHLLVTNDSVTATAAYFGYSDVFLFSRQFKEVLGMGPQDWRRAHAT